MFQRALKVFMVVLAASVFLPLLSSDADARIGGGRSFGSRGGRTFNSVPSTPTAPSGAPITRSYTQPGSPSSPIGAPAAQGSRFGGFGRLLVGGLLGAGLFGLLSGSGLFGGVSGLAGVMGLLIQIALFGGLAWLVWSFFRNRAATAAAGAPSGFGGPSPTAYNTNRDAYNGASNQGGFGGQPGGFGMGGGAASGQPLQIQQQDYSNFERILTEVQTAYGKADFNRLAELATPELLAYFSEDLKENGRNGVRNEISNVKFITGDLAEAWTERDEDYATVSMRYSLNDAMVEIASGRVVDGDQSHPQEITEIWTFLRNQRDMARGWMVSAIQQVGH